MCLSIASAFTRAAGLGQQPFSIKEHNLTYPDDEQFELLSDPYVFQHTVAAVTPL